MDVEVAISVDNGALKRLGERSLEALAGVKVWANIDHHRTNELFGDVQCVLPDECATGAVLYYFFKYLGIPVTPVMRDALYVAVSTDTGSFPVSYTHIDVYKRQRRRCVKRLFQRSVFFLKLIGADLGKMFRKHFFAGVITSFLSGKQGAGCQQNAPPAVGDRFRRVQQVRQLPVPSR